MLQAFRRLLTRRKEKLAPLYGPADVRVGYGVAVAE
jgi:hypothetical protein